MGNDVYSQSKFAFHRQKLESMLNGKITPPIYVRIKPTNACQHECFYCAYQPKFDCVVSEKFNLKDKIPEEKMMEILKDLNDMQVKAVTFSGGGEPLIYKPIIKTFEKTLEYGLELSIITNGQELRGKKAELLSQSEWVRISSDSCSKQNFKKIRNRPEKWFDKLVNNIQDFAKMKKQDCELGINYVVHHLNADQVFESAKFYKGLGVNNIKFTAQYNRDLEEYHNPFKKYVIEQIQKAKDLLTDERFSIYATYENDFNTSGKLERPYTRCCIIESVPVIGADSGVYFCHDKTYTTHGKIGSIEDKSFKELWFSEDTAKIFREFNAQKSCRHHCTYDGRNMVANEILENIGVIDKYKPKSERHKNFL